MATLLFLSWISANSVSAASYCSSTKPTIAPIITSIIPGNQNAKLTWIEAQDPFTHYLIAFGKSKDNLEYGLQNIGAKGTTQFVVNRLQNGVKYYFRIRAVNNCKPGNFSNTVSATIGTIADGHLPNLSIYKAVLGTSTSSATTRPLNNAKSGLEKNNLNACTNSCLGLPLLSLEAVLLIVFFLATTKIKSVQPFTSIIIPIIIAIFFTLRQTNCPPTIFFCRYFWQLNLLLYISTLIVFRRKTIKKRINELQNQIDQFLP